MNDGKPAADAGGPAPVVMAAPETAARGGDTNDTNTGAAAGPEPGAEAPGGAIDPAAEAAGTSYPAASPGRDLSPMEVMRATVKRMLAGIRGHLADAEKGDHRATVAAVTGLTDLVHHMLGPDHPEDSLRTALADLAAGRSDDARTALEAARAALAGGTAPVGADLAAQVSGIIGGALDALAEGAVQGCILLTDMALATLTGHD